VRGQGTVLSSSQTKPLCCAPEKATRCFGSKMFSIVSSRSVGFGGCVVTCWASAVEARRRAAATAFRIMARKCTIRRFPRKKELYPNDRNTRSHSQVRRRAGGGAGTVQGPRPYAGHAGAGGGCRG